MGSCSALESDQDEFMSCRVDLKRFHLFVVSAADQIAPRKVVVNLVAGKMIHGMALSPAPNTQYRDKCLKQIKTLNIEIDRWRTVLKSGMKALGRISELKREKSGQRDKDNPTPTTIAIESTSHDELLQMQDLCAELSYNCRDLKEVCENLDRIAER